MNERYLELSLGRARVLETGSGTPLLMLHGMGLSNSANTFDTIAPLLATRYRVIAPDLLGFGKGTRTVEDGPTFELMVEHLRELMDTLELARAVVVGHSMGGWTGVHLAYQSPDRVAKLVLLNAAGLNAQIAPGIGGLSEVPALEALRAQVHREFRDKAKAADALVDRIARTQHEMLSQPNALRSLDPLLRIMQSPALRARVLLHRRIGRVKAPALVVWGTGDPMDPYPTWNEEYERLGGDMSRSTKPWVIPGARHVRFDTGHYTHWEQPEALARLITEFVG